MRCASLIIGIATLNLLMPRALACPPEESGQQPVLNVQAEKPAPPATPGPPVSFASPTPSERNDPRYGLLTPITANGGLPKIYSDLYDLTAEQLQARAAARGYRQQIRRIRHKYFGEIKAEHVRLAGIELIREFTDPASFKSMIVELERENDDVRLAVLDHFAQQGEEGQAALAWVAIYDKDPAIRNEATRRMTAPAANPVRYIVNGGLRSDQHDVVNAAASLSGALNIVEAIPLLIFAQASVTGASESQGDIAWIAIQTQRAYVQSLEPVVGDNAGAFQPIVGIVSDGVVLRVMDAVVIEYRTEVHTVLVSMSTEDSGESTASMGYNVQAWWEWYNNQYLPHKQEQAQIAELASDPPKQRE